MSSSSSWWLRLTASLALTAGLTLSPDSRAEERAPKVVLVTNHADAAIMPLLRSELQGLGFDILLVDKGPKEIVAGDLSRAARKQGAIAAFRVLVTAGTVEVWIADRVTGKVVLRELFARSSSEKVSETVVVLQAVELLRASLMEVEAPHPPRGEVAPDRALYPVLGFPEESARFGVELGPSLLYSPGGMPPLWVARLGLRYRFHPWLQASLFGALALADAHREEPEGKVQLTARVLAAGLRVEPPPSADWLAPNAGVGFALLTTSTQGLPLPPSLGFAHDSLSPLPYVTAGASLVFHRNLRLTVEVLAGLGLQPLAIEFDDRRVATFGEVLLSPSLRLDMLLP